MAQLKKTMHAQEMGSSDKWRLFATTPPKNSMGVCRRRALIV